MSKTKRLLSVTLAIAMIILSAFSAFAEDTETVVETVGAMSVAAVSIETDDTTFDVNVKISFNKYVTGPHNIITLTCDNFNLTNVELGDVVYNYTSSKEVNGETVQLPQGKVTIAEDDVKNVNWATGKVLIEAPVDVNAPLVSEINLTATFTLKADVALVAGETLSITVANDDMADASETKLSISSSASVVTVHGAGTTYGHDETNHWHACVVEGCTEHKYDVAAHTMSDYVANEDGTTETATCTAKCGYSVTRNVVVDEEPEYDVKFGTTRAVRVIEPWAIRFRARARDNAVSGNPTISLSEFSDYGYYILPEIKVPDGVTVDQQYIIENGKHFDSSLCTKDGDYFVALYEDDLYTYMMGSNIYYIDYVVSNGVTVYSPDYYTTTLSTVIESRLSTLNDKVSPTDLEVIEINLLNCMNTMYEKVVAHRGSEYTPVEENIIPRVSDTQFADVVENSGYYFGTTRAVKVIEPWAIRFRNRIRNVSDGSTVALSSFVDYGFILLKSGDTLAETVDVNEMLTNEAGYVFSKSNGYATKDGDTEYFIGLFDDSIYTYQMSETYYYLRYYVTENGMVVDTAGVQQTSFETVINSRLSSISTAVEGDDTFTEKEVLESMLSLYTYVTAYRQ